MYESPIQITQIGEQISTELVEQEEEYIFSVVKRIYVDVNKDELIKALAYDRGQYDKGYFDGRAARDAEIVRCKECKHSIEDKLFGGLWCQHPTEKHCERNADFYCGSGERGEDVSNC